MTDEERVLALIDLDALEYNIKSIRKKTPEGTGIIGVIKADAYGHGSVEVAQVLLENGADWFAVAVVDEGLNLRKHGINAPILLLGYTPELRFEDVINNGFIQTMYSYEMAEKLSKTAVRLGKTAVVHIKIDTGMGRIGYRVNDEAADEIVRISKLPGIEVNGMFTHFAASEMLKEKGSNAKENQWLNKVCVISSSIPQMPSKVLPRIFDAVSEALYSEKKLRIEYTNMNGKTTSAVISPLALVQQDVRLYLICQFDHFDNVVHLALHRFKKAEVTSFDAHRPEEFDLQSYIHDRHFNYSNGEWVHWILEFKSDVTAKNLEETPFNTSQKLLKKEDGTWRLEVDIQDSRMLDGWVAMWKNDAQITLSQKEYLERETGDYDE